MLANSLIASRVHLRAVPGTARIVSQIVIHNGVLCTSSLSRGIVCLKAHHSLISVAHCIIVINDARFGFILVWLSLFLVRIFVVMDPLLSECVGPSLFDRNGCVHYGQDAACAAQAIRLVYARQALFAYARITV